MSGFIIVIAFVLMWALISDKTVCLASFFNCVFEFGNNAVRPTLSGLPTNVGTFGTTINTLLAQYQNQGWSPGSTTPQGAIS